MISFVLFWYLLSVVAQQTPLSTQPKLVVAHFMVGFTFPYTIADWSLDIRLAAAKGIDGFALNVGRDDWQPQRVRDAYAAAKQLSPGITFKLFISLDMTSLPCSTAQDANRIRSYISDYRTHPNQLYYNGAPLLSTFSGEWCTFGQNGQNRLNAAWYYAIRDKQPSVSFIPAFFVDPKAFPSLNFIDGAFNWNSAWPMGNYNTSLAPDNEYTTQLRGRAYMAGISPWFFTHYGPDSWNKNWIYRCDDWHFARRWELVIQNRNLTQIVQVVSMNDFSEAHYLGSIHGAQPKSEAWTNGYDHQGWLDLQMYYIAAFKSGQYPPILKDRIFLWARLYPTSANSPDRTPKPANWQWTKDVLWAVALLTAPANITIACGSSKLSSTYPGGLCKLQIPLAATCSVTASITRNSTVVVNFAPPGFSFSNNPPSYNYNAFVAASP